MNPDYFTTRAISTVATTNRWWTKGSRMPILVIKLCLRGLATDSETLTDVYKSHSLLLLISFSFSVNRDKQLRNVENGWSSPFISMKWTIILIWTMLNHWLYFEWLVGFEGFAIWLLVQNPLRSVFEWIVHVLFALRLFCSKVRLVEIGTED